MAALLRGVLRCCSLTPACTGSVQVKRHVRALRRSPVRVLHPGGDRDDQPGTRRPQEPGHRRTPPVPGSKASTGDTSRRKSPAEGQEDELSSEELKFEKAAPGDKRLSNVVTIAKSKKFRDRHGKVLLEGWRLLTDALEAGAVLQTLFFNTADQLKELPHAKLKKANLVKVKFADTKMWSDLVTPQGLIGIFLKPDHAKINYPAIQMKHSLPLTLICDNIRDPGNLGTILRCAAGAGCNKVLLTKGCVDAWEPKVLRAGMGAHFRLPIITSVEWDIIPNFLTADTKVYLADNCRLDSGNEVQTGKASDYGWVSTQPKSMARLQEDYYSSSDEESDGEERNREELHLPDIKKQSYHERWAKDNTALVIGGETYGLSLESLLLAKKSGGRKLFIPVVPGVDSLNSAMAASILLFEGKRQLQTKERRAT